MTCLKGSEPLSLPAEGAVDSLAEPVQLHYVRNEPMNRLERRLGGHVHSPWAVPATICQSGDQRAVSLIRFISLFRNISFVVGLAGALVKIPPDTSRFPIRYN